MFLDIARQRNAELASFRDALTVFRGSGAGQPGQDAIRLSELLPELAKLFCLALTIPVTTSTAERSFSTLRRLKTYLRSTMTQERLNHIAVLHVHKSVSDAFRKILDCTNLGHLVLRKIIKKLLPADVRF